MEEEYFRCISEDQLISVRLKSVFVQRMGSSRDYPPEQMQEMFGTHSTHFRKEKIRYGFKSGHHTHD